MSTINRESIALCLVHCVLWWSRVTRLKLRSRPQRAWHLHVPLSVFFLCHFSLSRRSRCLAFLSLSAQNPRVFTTQNRYRPAGGTAVQHLSLTRTILYGIFGRSSWFCLHCGPQVLVNSPTTIRAFFKAVKPVLESRQELLGPRHWLPPRLSSTSLSADGIQKPTRADWVDRQFLEAKEARGKLTLREKVRLRRLRKMGIRYSRSNATADRAARKKVEEERQRTEGQIAGLEKLEASSKEDGGGGGGSGGRGGGSRFTLREKVKLRKLKMVLVSLDAELGAMSLDESLDESLGDTVEDEFAATNMYDDAEVADKADIAREKAAEKVAATNVAATNVAAAKDAVVKAKMSLAKVRAARAAMRAEIADVLEGGASRDPSIREKIALRKYKNMLEEERREAAAAEAAEAAETAAEEAAATHTSKSSFYSNVRGFFRDSFCALDGGVACRWWRVVVPDVENKEEEEDRPSDGDIRSPEEVWSIIASVHSFILFARATSLFAALPSLPSATPDFTTLLMAIVVIVAIVMKANGVACCRCGRRRHARDRKKQLKKGKRAAAVWDVCGVQAQS